MKRRKWLYKRRYYIAARISKNMCRKNYFPGKHFKAVFTFR